MSTNTTAKEKKLRRHLVDLTTVVGSVVARIDAEMALPSTPERGRRIAALTNELELANDQARHFGLGIDLRKDASR